ncbi:unnamed protein product [marine sediment metagenome]|uniref:Uncharacterized protein n=1 Tax=marine sediment metagenome TaxID=412755 RepID=X1R392_9ZZZZ
MEKSVVKFASVKFKKLEPDATLPAKFKRMLDLLPLKRMVERKSVALKMHLGGNLGYTTIHPLFYVHFKKLTLMAKTPLLPFWIWYLRILINTDWI